MEGSVDCKKSDPMVLNVFFVLFTEPVGYFFFFVGCWAGIRMFLHEQGACQNYMKRFPL